MQYYFWIKALHIIFVISWMAGLFYLPRLFVYHVKAEKGSVQSETFKLMERRLLRVIMNPAMILTWVFGVWMIIMAPSWMHEGWFHLKLLLVVILSAFHMFLARCRRLFEQDQNFYSEKFYRYINEIPTILMIIIVILVVVRPF